LQAFQSSGFLLQVATVITHPTCHKTEQCHC